MFISSLFLVLDDVALLRDVEAVEELPDVLVLDGGGLLDQGRALKRGRKEISNNVEKAVFDTVNMQKGRRERGKTYGQTVVELRTQRVYFSLRRSKPNQDQNQTKSMGPLDWHVSTAVFESPCQ